MLDVPHKDLGKVNTKAKIPSIHEWRRLAVSSAPVAEDDGAPVVKEAFDPATLSKAAHALLRGRLLLDDPTHILIERQRFRSMGSKHILEWTIRVNMFESILYAVLGTLKAEGIWTGEVVPVTPMKVGPFWLGEDLVKRATGPAATHRKERRTKSAKTLNKGLKIDLVRRWLEVGNMVELESVKVKDMAAQYMEKWDRLPGGKKLVRTTVIGEKEEEMGKLDDLADCLLQGMAWISWEENKRIALEHGVEALLDKPVSTKKRRSK